MNRFFFAEKRKCNKKRIFYAIILQNEANHNVSRETFVSWYKKRANLEFFYSKRIVSRETKDFEQQIRSLKINSLKVIEKHNKNSGLFHVKQPQLPLLSIQVF